MLTEIRKLSDLGIGIAFIGFVHGSAIGLNDDDFFT